VKITRLFVLATFALPIAAAAQPVLSADYFPKIGDRIKLKPATANGVQEGPAGAAQTWDFAALQTSPNAEVIALNFVDAAQTPYAESFPVAILASEYVAADGGKSYGYFNPTGNELWFLGSAAEGGTETYGNPNLFARTPMTFGQVSQSQYDGKVVYADFKAHIKASKTTRYDAYGTLKLPGYNLNNIIRTRTDETRTDSVAFDNGAYTLNIAQSVTYGWFAPKNSNAVLEIRTVAVRTRTVVPGFPPQENTQPVQKTILFQSAVATPVLETPRAPATFELRMVSANPSADGEARFELNAIQKTNVNVWIANAMGLVLSRETRPLDGGAQSFAFDLSRYPAGAYTVTFEDGNGVATRTVVKL
jgi:hypothetical protein